MWKYILQRIGFAIITLFIIVFIVYLLTAQYSENPFVNELNTQKGDSGINPTTLESKKIELFNKSVQYHFLPASWEGKYNQYRDIWTTYKLNSFIRFSYWISDLFTNKEHPFGLPFAEGLFSSTGAKSIPNLFFRNLKYSVIVTIPAFIISAILGILFGIFAGYKRGTWVDTVVNIFALIFIALPSFIIAPILISILTSAGVAPVVLKNTTGGVQYSTTKIIVSWLPPIAIVTLGSLSVYINYTRNQVITVLTSNYVLIAKSKGLSRTEIFFKYVLRNISIPLAAIIIPSYIGLLTGGIVIETYWQVPGTSFIITQSFPNGEINIIMFNTFFFTLLGVFTTILVDISYTFLDPRIKYSTKASTWMILLKATLRRNAEFKKLQSQKGV
ncbi:oligopeptide transport system permease protein [Mycoplasmopsis mustelae]|uniref:Oligopeptide transport system permease protein n=1 Tax=Mycoplasmopsis mustelae TaxID=171289 RepID=A0A4R7UER3_9BACT|nr:ABC transporter permease [Mycoplasmopsis mustelae]TDV24411.1 oligopeptide transport system permease protein [Mycoplasmopsis mustelae]